MVSREPLSPKDLLDTVIVTLTTSEPEALYLLDKLEEAGIPARRAEGNLAYIPGPPEIRVPRKLLADARSVVDAARAELQQRQIDNAFDFSSAAENQPVNDPTFDAMHRLSGLPKAERDEALEEYIRGWVFSGCSAVEIARYLSAAGLEQTEAEAMYNARTRDLQSGMEERQRTDRLLGLLLLGLSIVLFAAASVLDGYNPRIRMILLALAVPGLLFLYHSSRPLPNLRPYTAPDDENGGGGGGPEPAGEPVPDAPKAIARD